MHRMVWHDIIYLKYILELLFSQILDRLFKDWLVLIYSLKDLSSRFLLDWLESFSLCRVFTWFCIDIYYHYLLYIGGDINLQIWRSEYPQKEFIERTIEIKKSVPIEEIKVGELEKYRCSIQKLEVVHHTFTKK